MTPPRMFAASRNLPTVALLLSLLVLSTAAAEPARTVVHQHVTLGKTPRKPVAAQFWDDQTAVIACHHSGSLIFWDLTKKSIRHEFVLGKQLRGVVRGNDDHLFVIDEKANELILARYADGQLTELSRAAVPLGPVAIASVTDEHGPGVAVASLWARKIGVWRNKDDALHCSSSFELPFEPRYLAVEQVETKPRLHIAAAFSGDYGQWNLAGKALRTHHEPNVVWGGLTVFANRALLPSTTFSPSPLPLTRENVAAGAITQSVLYTFASDETGSRSENLFYDGQNADPGGIAHTQRGTLVSLAGVDQVWYRAMRPDARPVRLPVGQRPRVVIARDTTALVLGELDDTITRIETKNSNLPIVTTSLLDPALAQRVLSPAERGERLFFSARMSVGGRMSCHTCHIDGHTNGLLADTLGDNTHGTPKRVLTLRGTRLTDLWAWNGEMKTLQDNVHKSLRDTMHAPEIKPADIDDLVSFLHTLPPVPPIKPEPTSALDAELVARGKQVFERENCTRCHVPPLTFTSHDIYDVGIHDEQGLKKFNPPSLRGVGRLKRLFHDNRASSLAEVFETHGHQLTTPLSPTELQALVRYLESL
jgi:hypothetical protein